eukprot:sb/3479026/
MAVAVVNWCHLLAPQNILSGANVLCGATPAEMAVTSIYRANPFLSIPVNRGPTDDCTYKNIMYMFVQSTASALSSSVYPGPWMKTLVLLVPDLPRE